MKTRVISLPSREDRRKSFTETNEVYLKKHDWCFVDAIDGAALSYSRLTTVGFDTDKNWRDPLLKRTLTWGEVGCFLSHWKLWEECAEGNEPMMILEDDAFFFDHVEDSDFTGDITYLCHKEMLPQGVKEDRVCYPYWTAAYILSPSAAQTLLDTNADQEIIPVDEFLPRMTDVLYMVSLDRCGQVPRKTSGTDVEPRSHSAYVRDFTVHNLTCGDDESRMVKLLDSNPGVVNILKGRWEGGDMRGPGGGQKVNELKSYIEYLPDHDVVLFTDAFDVFHVRSLDEIVGRYLEMGTEVVFAAERYKWPNPSLRFPPVVGPYRYLNSGCFIGRVRELKRMLSLPIENHADDQLYMQEAYLTGQYDVKLDTEQYIFMTNDPDVTVVRETLFNPLTKCFGCIYHGNGGDAAKAHFDHLYDGVYPEKKYARLSVSDYKVIGPEMLLVDFMTPTQCQEWITIGDQHGGWNPHYADKFPSHDIHLNQLGLMEECNSWWKKVLAPLFEQYWKPTHHWQLRKAFLMRYSVDTQKTLGLHNDAALVTGSVKLNDDYEGATLIFPRQGITNKDIPIGKMIVFPSQLTHGHHVDELTAGVKYSATFWTSRFKDDLLND